VRSAPDAGVLELLCLHADASSIFTGRYQQRIAVGLQEPLGWVGDAPLGTIADIRRTAHQRRPFYSSVHYTAPHWPWEGPGDEAVSRKLTNLFHLDGGSPAIYAEMVKRLDGGVGCLLATLDDTGIADDTIVIFTSDNRGAAFLGGMALHRQQGRRVRRQPARAGDRPLPWSSARR
jgi:hypothetical protein